MIKRCSRCGFETPTLVRGMCSECREVMADPEYMVDDKKELSPSSIQAWRRSLRQRGNAS